MGPHDLSPRSSGSHSERHRIRRIAKACAFPLRLPPCSGFTVLPSASGWSGVHRVGLIQRRRAVQDSQDQMRHCRAVSMRGMCQTFHARAVCPARTSKAPTVSPHPSKRYPRLKRLHRKTTPDPHAPARPQKKRVSHVEDDMEPARPPPFPRPDHPSSHDSLGSGASFDRASFPPYSQAPHESAAPSSSTSAHQRSHTPFSAHMAPLAPDYSARHLSQPEPIIQPPAKRLKRDTKKAVDRVEGILYSLLQVHCRALPNCVCVHG